MDVQVLRAFGTNLSPIMVHISRLRTLPSALLLCLRRRHLMLLQGTQMTVIIISV